MHHYLIIDDDDVFNFLHTKAIRKVEKDSVIEAFASSPKGVEHLKSLFASNAKLPDILLLDIRMPEMNGFEVLDELIKLPSEKLATMKIYMLTSSLDDRDKNRSKDYSIVSGFLSKTLSDSMIRRILEGNEEWITD